MYRSTNRQRSLFEVESRVGASVRKRLKRTWAEVFHTKVLPVLLREEALFSCLYDERIGRPNWSIARMLGICFLQELNGYDDQRAVDSFAFDVRWQHALGVTGEEAYLSRRSLIDFRGRLVECDPQGELMRQLFEEIGNSAIDDLGIKVSEQRIDSTIIESNIMVRGKLTLFKKTLVYFLDWLTKSYPKKMRRLRSKLRKWYKDIVETGGDFSRLNDEKKRVQLKRLAEFMYEAIECFSKDREVKSSERYLLLVRVFNENCEVCPPKPPGDDDDTNRKKSQRRTRKNKLPEIKVKAKKDKASQTVQSPHDTDAGIGHKGPGYYTHITETCRNEGPEIITDYEVVRAGDNDMGKEKGALSRLDKSGKRPDKLYADAGYPTAEGIYEAHKNGTELVAPIADSREEGRYSRTDYLIDERGICHFCPAGIRPIKTIGRLDDEGYPFPTKAVFDGEKCRTCRRRKKCIAARTPRSIYGYGNRYLNITGSAVLRDQYIERQKHEEWWDDYKIRAGIEASITELKRAHGLGKLRVRGRARVNLAVSMKVTACNIKRWMKGVLAS